MGENHDAFIKAFDADDPDIVKQLRTAVSSDMDEYDFRDDLMLNAADEIEHLRALITAWADATDTYWDSGDGMRRFQADLALRKAVGR